MMRRVVTVCLGLAFTASMAACGESVCQDGAKRDCETACGKGTEICVANSWQNCTAKQPETEVCDGVDNNCDGEVDEICECIAGLTEKCYSGPAGSEVKGQCKTGMRTCTAGRWGMCFGEIVPDNTEKCDGVDNNCNGTIDEGCLCVHGASESCFTGPATSRGIGKCKDGAHTCSMGVWGQCVGEILPDSAEKCDGVDNTCDGKVDETCTCIDGQKQACSTPCGTGEAVCISGSWQNCSAPQPKSETCDGIDNNCDGKVDETCNCIHGAIEACFEGASGNRKIGACKDGTHVCDKGVWGPCLNQVLPTASDVCTNNIDDDCDGTVNDGCVCTPGATQACGSDTGECTKGTQTCSGVPAWGDCVNEVKPVVETCDGKDNDCNGLTDDAIAGDTGEPNGTCAAAKLVPVLESATYSNECSGKADGTACVPNANYQFDGVCKAGACITALNYTVYPTGDVDYIKLTATEDYTHLCVPIQDPKCGYLSLELVQPSTTGVLYQATVYTGGTCGSGTTVTMNKTNPKKTLAWSGTCGFSMTTDFWVKVEPTGSSNPTFTCQPYQLKAYFDVVAGSAAATCP